MELDTGGVESLPKPFPLTEKNGLFDYYFDINFFLPLPLIFHYGFTHVAINYAIFDKHGISIAF